MIAKSIINKKSINKDKESLNLHKLHSLMQRFSKTQKNIEKKELTFLENKDLVKAQNAIETSRPKVIIEKPEDLCPDNIDKDSLSTDLKKIFECSNYTNIQK